MSTITTILLLLGILATAVFAAGFLRGLAQAIDSRSRPDRRVPVSEDEHWPSVLFAIVVSALVIASVGFIPAAVYAGPLLVIVTAAATGIAFFLDPGEGRPSA